MSRVVAESGALCLCRDRPEGCPCTRRAVERRERIQIGMAFGMNKAPRQVPPAPSTFPLQYGERDSGI